MSDQPSFEPLLGTTSSLADQIDARSNARIEKHQIEISNEHWIKSYWRPVMGWLYMLICLVDFVIFPALAMFLPLISKGFGIDMVYAPWQSLTLINGGLVHMAFGAILGIAAWSRGREKIAGISS